MKKVILSSLIIFVLISLLSTVSNAAEAGNFYFSAINNTTSEPVSELGVSVYQLGILTENGNFVLAPKFEKCGLNINDLTQANIDAFKKYATEYAEPVFIKSTDSNGKFTLTNVELGVYLFVQNSKTEDYTMQTMLVTLPEVSGGTDLSYELTVKPKIVTVDKTETMAPPTVIATTLPYTGILNWPVPVLVILGIAVFCIGWLKFYTTSKKKVI